jgi:hypothetical protein
VNTSGFIKFNSASDQGNTSDCQIQQLWSSIRFHQNQNFHPRAFVIIKFSDYYGAFDINSEAVYINSGIWIGFSHLEAKYIQVSFLTSYSHIEAQVIHIMFIFHLALFIIF